MKRIFDNDDVDEESVEADPTASDRSDAASRIVRRYRLPPLSVTVFERDHDGTAFRDFSLQRAYPKDDDGEEFGYTTTLRPRDLRKAARLLQAVADRHEGLKVVNVDAE